MKNMELLRKRKYEQEKKNKKINKMKHNLLLQKYNYLYN